MENQNKFLPQMKHRCTQITQNFFHLRSSDFYLWLILFLFFFSTILTSVARAGVTTKSSVDEILDALDARGKNLQDFSAKVKLSDTDETSGDSTINTGAVIFQRVGDDDARIRVAFDKRQIGNAIKDVNHVYTLDKGVLDERDYIKRTETQMRILKPGQKLDLFKLGEGPFPLPIGQKKDDVLKSFDVVKVDPAAGDPPNTVHLRLTPKDGTPLARKFKVIDVLVDTGGAMPRRIQTEDLNQTTTRTTDLTDVKINGGAGDKDFSQQPVPKDWDVVVEPYGQ
jgi:outer membrane lipoprotein-sorting protein